MFRWMLYMQVALLAQFYCRSLFANKTSRTFSMFQGQNFLDLLIGINAVFFVYLYNYFAELPEEKSFYYAI